MILPSNNRDLEQACLLLQEYSFELGGFNPQELVQFWQQNLEVDATWIRAAVLEALYQGRYKAFSVGQILQMWKRRQQSVRHFNHDFERVVFGPLDPHCNPGAFVNTPLQATNSTPVTPAAVEADTIPPMAAELPYFNDAEPLPSSAEQTKPLPVSLAETSIATSEFSPAREVPPQVNPESSAISSPNEASDDTFHTPEPIQKFVPVQQPSGFYDRLQAVARISP